MPIAIAEPYRTYERRLREGRLELPEGKRCPREGTTTLVLSTSVVERGLIVLQQDSYGDWRTVKLSILVALVRCSSCKGRWRVLPSDVLPHKTYGLCVIELGITAYSVGDRSLRRVAWFLLDGERIPAHTTLHGWTEGMGAWALGREIGEVPGTEPFAALLAETRRHWPLEVDAVFEQPAHVDSRRYRSEERLERLAAVKRAIAISIDESEGDRPLCSWFRIVQTPAFGLTSPVSFRTGLSCTPFELVGPGTGDTRGP